MSYIADNLISQNQQKSVYNDVADSAMVPFEVSCVYPAGESNVFPGMCSFVGTWKLLYSHVLISSGEMVFD